MIELPAGITARTPAPSSAPAQVDVDDRPELLPCLPLGGYRGPDPRVVDENVDTTQPGARSIDGGLAHVGIAGVGLCHEVRPSVALDAGDDPFEQRRPAGRDETRAAA